MKTNVPSGKSNTKLCFSTRSSLIPRELFIKDGNILVAKFTVTGDWKFSGKVFETDRFPLCNSCELSDAECKNWLYCRTLHHAEQIECEHDTMGELFLTRGMNTFDNLWIAWLVDETAEVYHPNFRSAFI